MFPNLLIYIFSCQGQSCRMYLGGNKEDTNHQFHLSDVEIDRIFTEGTIYFGDRLDWTDDIGEVIVDGVSFDSASTGVHVSALEYTVT